MSPLRTNIQSAFTQDFCSELEYHLTRAFINCNGRFNQLWCDGIDVPDFNYQPRNQPNKVFTMAWFGETGQDRYKMTIKLGKKALKYCSEGLSLSDCLPPDGRLDWVYLDVENKEIAVSLK
jgi:hypothetical protein